MTKMVLKLLIVSICMMITGIGASLALKAAVGVGAWDALSQSLSSASNIKVGTLSMLLNISCVLIQLVMLKRDFKFHHVIQVFVSIILGFVVNFMIYDVLSGFTISNYFYNILLLIVSLIICAAAVSLIMAINFITFPLESCCMVIANKINKNFGLIRQSVDVISIVLALAISFIFQESITVREGTVIAMLLFGPLLDLFMKMHLPRLKKIGLVD